MYPVYHWYVESERNDTNELIYRTNNLTDIEIKLTVTRREAERGESGDWD